MFSVLFSCIFDILKLLDSLSFNNGMSSKNARSREGSWKNFPFKLDDRPLLRTWEFRRNDVMQQNLLSNSLFAMSFFFLKCYSNKLIRVASFQFISVPHFHINKYSKCTKQTSFLKLMEYTLY